MKKREIEEVLDSDGNLIGQDDKPSNNPNEIGADGTTDHNAAIGHQHFAHDFLGRFGFYMYNEGEGDDNTLSTDDLINDIAREAYVFFDGDNDNFTAFDQLSQEVQNKYYDFANKVIGILHGKSEKEQLEPTLSESELSKMIEDVITKRDDDKSIVKRGDNDLLDDKTKGKIKSLLSTLSDKDKGELIKHLKN